MNREESLGVLQAEVKSRQATLRRAELLRGRRKKSLFTQDKMGNLRVERKDLEVNVHTDNKKHVEVMLPAEIPPVPPGSPMDDGLSKWKEVHEVVCCARATSASGPNFGVYYRLYKSIYGSLL